MGAYNWHKTTCNSKDHDISKLLSMSCVFTNYAMIYVTCQLHIQLEDTCHSRGKHKELLPYYVG